MNNYIEEKFYKELVEMSPLKGRDMHNRPPLYDTPDEKIEEIKQFIKEALQEQEERIKQEMKEKIEKRKKILSNQPLRWSVKDDIEFLEDILKELNI